jgi:DNA-binding GntR family transcriptional regulator
MFERKPLRADVGAEILGRIIDGRLPSGTRINESRLSQELGISRTPLREAMLCLTTEGVLVSDMGRGFVVPPLARREIGDLTDALAVVLAAVMRQGPGEAAGELKAHVELGNLIGRARMQTGASGPLAEHLYHLLDAFCGQCSNLVMQRHCRELVRKSLRYLFAAHERGWNPGSLLDGLETSLGRLRAGDRPGAAEALNRTVRELGIELAQRFPSEQDDEG